MTALVSTIGVAAMLIGALYGCANDHANERNRFTLSREGDSSRWNAAGWHPPAIADLPEDSLGTAVRRGFALITATHDSLPQFVAANLNCTSCHLDGGRRATASPLGG